MTEREGRCPVCGHIRPVDSNGRLRLHHPSGSAACEGTDRLAQTPSIQHLGAILKPTGQS